MTRAGKLLFTIILLAFVLRVVGIDYGLPLWVVADEPPFVYSPLKMIELRSLVPAFHPESFQGYLYFPPFLVYLLIIPFILILGVKYLLSGLSFDIYQSILSHDLSALFLMGRFLSVLVGCLTIWLVYKTVKNLVKDETPALLSALVLTLSLLHLNFSHWVRHWSFVTALFASVLFLLSSGLELRKKYFYSSIVAGISFGFSYQGGIAALLIILWFLYNEDVSIKEAVKQAWGWKSAVAFASISLLVVALYPDNGNLAQISASSKTIMGLVGTLWFYLKTFILAEPALSLLTFTGFWGCFLYRKKLAYVVSIFSIAYLGLFYLLFVVEARYLLMLYPLFAVITGIGVYELWIHFVRGRKFIIVSTAVLVAVMFVGAVSFNLTLLRGDTRSLASDWANENLDGSTKIVTVVRLFRLQATKEAINLQESIDPASIRNIDRIEDSEHAGLLIGKKFYALNLGTFSDENFTSDVLNYMKENNYEYFIMSEEEAILHDINLESLEGVEPVVIFKGYDDSDTKRDMTNGYGGNYFEVIGRKNNGPTIKIYKIE